jgi:adenine-specific DNA-methyltransferase
MAYLKQWAPRSFKELELRRPALLDGPGRTIPGDAQVVIDELPEVDLMYLDPPYNQHRYFSNYHIWETLVRWDAPEHYGVACKRIDTRDPSTKSVFNSKPKMATAFKSMLSRARAKVLVVSYNDEAWITPEEMTSALQAAGHQKVSMLSYDYKRYVGAQIGIFNPSGEKVGQVSHLRNHEHIFVAGPEALLGDFPVVDPS